MMSNWPNSNCNSSNNLNITTINNNNNISSSNNPAAHNILLPSINSAASLSSSIHLNLSSLCTRPTTNASNKSIVTFNSNDKMNQQHQQASSNSHQLAQQAPQQMTTVKRPQHNVKLASALNSMLECGSLVDVTIYCDDGQVNAHKLVLAASSIYFRNLFTRMTNTFHYPIIVLREIPFNDLKTIIHFIYYGEIYVPPNNVESLTRWVNYLQIEGMEGSLNALLAASSSSMPSLSHTLKSNPQYPPGLQNRYSLQSPSTNQRTLMELQNGELKSRQQGASNRRVANATRRRGRVNVEGTSDMNQQMAMTNNYQINNLAFPSGLGGNSITEMSDDLRSYNQAGSSSRLINQPMMSEAKSSRGANSSKEKFQCPTCHKFFTHGFTLKRHMKLHANQRPLVYCDTCSKSYSCRDSFLRHKKSSGHLQHAEYHRSIALDIGTER